MRHTEHLFDLFPLVPVRVFLKTYNYKSIYFALNFVGPHLSLSPFFDHPTTPGELQDDEADSVFEAWAVTEAPGTTDGQRPIGTKK